MERQPNAGTREELEASDDARPTTGLTGAGGEAFDDDDTTRETSDRAADVSDASETVVGASAGGGSPPGFVGTPPDANWPDPLGGEDDERELERRTR